MRKNKLTQKYLLENFFEKTNELAALFVDIVSVALKRRMFFHIMYQENIQILKKYTEIENTIIEVKDAKKFWEDWKVSEKTKTFGLHLSTVEHKFEDEDRAGTYETFTVEMRLCIIRIFKNLFFFVPKNFLKL